MLADCSAVIYGEEGSVAEDYALENGFSFVDVSSHDHEHLADTTVYEDPYMKITAKYCSECGYAKDIQQEMKNTDPDADITNGVYDMHLEKTHEKVVLERNMTDAQGVVYSINKQTHIANVVGLMMGTSVWNEVRERYPELKSDDEIADEVLATYSGRRGSERLREEMDRIKGSERSVADKARALGALERVRRALDRFWHGVADFLGIHYGSADEVADRVMRDLLSGVDPRRFVKGESDGRGREQFVGKPFYIESTSVCVAHCKICILNGWHDCS